MAAGDLRGTVKTASGDGITSRSLTWDGGGSAPQSGDKLFCLAVTGHSSGANTPTGWTSRLEFGFPDADDIATLFEREAGASETGVTVTIPGSNELNLIGFCVEGTLTYDDENITAEESDSSSIETGNVNISPAADTFFIGVGATNAPSVTGSMHSSDANSFTLAAQVQAANKLAIAAYRKVLGASGNYSTRFSWSPYDAGFTNRGAIAAYAISTGGGESHSASMTGTGTASLSKQVSRARDFSYSGVGSPTLSTLAARYLTFGFSATGALTLARAVGRSQTHAFTGIGTVSASAVKQDANTVNANMTGVGSSALSTQTDRFRSFGFTAQGTPVLGVQTSRFRAFSYGGQGTLQLAVGRAFARALAFTGTATPVVSTDHQKRKVISITVSGAVALAIVTDLAPAGSWVEESGVSGLWDEDASVDITWTEDDPL